MALIASIYLLGGRPREICCLKFSDFNFKSMYVRIDGKNNKTKKSRLVPIPHSLMKIYKAYFGFPKHRYWHGSPYLFPSMQSQHVSPERVKHLFREKVLKPLGFWKAPEVGKVSKFRLYTLRHSRASHILNRQIKEFGSPDLFSISNFLGHSDIRSSMVYLHQDSNYMKYLSSVTDV